VYLVRTKSSLCHTGKRNSIQEMLKRRIDGKREGDANSPRKGVCLGEGHYSVEKAHPLIGGCTRSYVLWR